MLVLITVYLILIKSFFRNRVGCIDIEHWYCGCFVIYIHLITNGDVLVHIYTQFPKRLYYTILLFCEKVTLKNHSQYTDSICICRKILSRHWDLFNRRKVNALLLIAETRCTQLKLFQTKTRFNYNFMTKSRSLHCRLTC